MSHQTLGVSPPRPLSRSILLEDRADLVFSGPPLTFSGVSSAGAACAPRLRDPAQVQVPGNFPLSSVCSLSSSPVRRVFQLFPP